MIIYIPGLYRKTGFVAFLHAIRNWWENPIIFYIMQNTVEWEFDRRELAILWDKCGYLYPKSVA